MPARTLTPEQRIVRLEKGQRDTVERLNQVRRAMGFNGKVDDPEIEANLAAGFKELALIASARRETETVERAKAILKTHYSAQMPRWLVWSFGHLRRKVVWGIAAIAAAFLWGFGNRLNDALHVFLHAQHLFGQ